jgi:SWI/SNF-related matrix-associated actin-dependent regulator 1 of chromatin subfamily A
MHPSLSRVVFTFGKHIGETLAMVAERDLSYLKWLATTEGMNANWKTAAVRAIHDESVEDLSLPRVNVSEKPIEKAFFQALGNVSISYLSKDKAAIRFAYNPGILSRFKSEIDGRKWDGDKKHWEVSITQLPKAIKLFGGPKGIEIDDKVKKLVVDEVNRRKDLDEIRVLEKSDIKIPTKIPLYPYQTVAVEFAERAGGRVLVADEVGLGKTFVAIGYALKNKLKTIIVCPAAVKINWTMEIERVAGKKCCVWDSKTATGHKGSQFHVINYDSVAKQILNLNKIDFDFLVCDEVTDIKNKKTLKAKAVFGDGRMKKKFPGIKTKHAMMLTATPVMNRPSEIFTFLNFLSKERFPNYFAFTQMYGGWRGSPPRNLKDLHDRTKDLLIRRLLTDVGSERPRKQVNEVYIGLDPTETKEYNKLLRDLFGAWASGKVTIAAMPAIQRFLISKKLPRAIEMIEQFTAAGRGVVIFCSYLEPLYELKKHFGSKAGIIEGSMSLAKRQLVINAVREKKLGITLASLKAARQGIDGLQYGANIGIFLDQDWVPANHHQAEGRIDRTGQPLPVQIFYPLCTHTIDEDMRILLKEKQEIADQIVDGSIMLQVREKSIFAEFVKRLKKQNKGFDFEYAGID